MVINNQSDCKIAKFLKHIKISRPLFHNTPIKNYHSCHSSNAIKSKKQGTASD